MDASAKKVKQEIDWIQERRQTEDVFGRGQISYLTVVVVEIARFENGESLARRKY